MIRTHSSPPATPRDRGLAFGAAFEREIRRTAEHYRELFSSVAGRAVDPAEFGPAALAAIEAFSPDAADEIHGIAEGAGLDAGTVAALNARTEVLASLGARLRGECSTVVTIDPSGARAPVTLQTWDWVDVFVDDWLLWSIEHPDGTVVHTVTEFGILGKIGVNNHGVGVHFNILHHERDGDGIGVPIHVLARTVLDRARHIGRALDLVGSAVTSASSALTLVGADAEGASALSAELSPVGPRFVLPDDDGLLIHTNHFLDPNLARDDREPRVGPDTWLRYSTLRGRLAGRRDLGLAELTGAMTSHHGGGGALCCHPEPDAALAGRWQTLVTVSLDVAAGTLSVLDGGPCDAESPWTTPAPSTTAAPTTINAIGARP